MSAAEGSPLRRFARCHSPWTKTEASAAGVPSDQRTMPISSRLVGVSNSTEVPM